MEEKFSAESSYGGGGGELDHCLVDANWRFSFPHAFVEVLPPHNFDHNPLLLSCLKDRSVRSRQFHFQAAWIFHPQYEPWLKILGARLFLIGIFLGISLRTREEWKLELEASISGWIFSKPQT